jgi:hypothetical protein
MIRPPRLNPRRAPVNLDFVARDPNSLVDEDLLCRKCGYNLRGLAFGGRCPECNSAVIVSTQDDALRFSHPSWLRQLSTGAAILMAEKIFYFGWTLIRLFLILRWHMRFRIDVMTCIIQAIAAFGWWIIATPDPAGLGETAYGRSRRVARGSSIILMVNAFLWQIEKASLFPPDIDHMFVLTLLVLGITAIVAQIARYSLLAGIAQRVPNDSLTRKAKKLRLAATALATASLASSSIYWGAAIAGRPVPLAPGVYALISFFILVFEMILTVVSLSLVGDLKSRIDSQARVAVRFWSANEL